MSALGWQQTRCPEAPGNNELITSSHGIKEGDIRRKKESDREKQNSSHSRGIHRHGESLVVGSQREVGKGLEEGGRGQDVMPPLGAALMGIWASEAYSFYPVSASRFLSILFHNTLGDVYVLQDARKIRSRLHSDIRRFMMRRIREASCATLTLLRICETPRIADRRKLLEVVSIGEPPEIYIDDVVENNVGNNENENDDDDDDNEDDDELVKRNPKERAISIVMPFRVLLFAFNVQRVEQFTGQFAGQWQTTGLETISRFNAFIGFASMSARIDIS
ncbi:hypothetical protein V1478_018767 [Vespula squamosa]|uniref:Uncharacterized protein n=1 Tax=Vespula squamosa TaxID=30214 RepID=A0ABD1ZTQ6_VESSQ